MEVFAAIEHGAALVYHAVLATGVPVVEWEADHPAIAPLVQTGLDYATSALSRFGGSVAASRLVARDITAALKATAAADATVPSITTISHEQVVQQTVDAAIARLEAHPNPV